MSGALSSIAQELGLTGPNGSIRVIGNKFMGIVNDGAFSTRVRVMGKRESQRIYDAIGAARYELNNNPDINIPGVRESYQNEIVELNKLLTAMRRVKPDL